MENTHIEKEKGEKKRYMGNCAQNDMEILREG